MQKFLGHILGQLYTSSITSISCPLRRKAIACPMSPPRKVRMTDIMSTHTIRLKQINVFALSVGAI